MLNQAKLTLVLDFGETVLADCIVACSLKLITCSSFAPSLCLAQIDISSQKLNVKRDRERERQTQRHRNTEKMRDYGAIRDLLLGEHAVAVSIQADCSN